MPSDIANKPAQRVRLPIWKIATYSGLVAGAIVILSLLVLLLFPDIYINKYFKEKIIKDFTSEYPGYSLRITDFHFYIFQNRIELGSMAINSADSSFSCSIANSTLKGIHWFQLILNGVNSPGALSGSVAESHKLILKLPKSQYKFLCRRLYVSINDSEISADSLELNPLVEDKQFFENSKFRRTRVSMVLPQLKVSGLNCLGLIQGKMYHARFVQMSDVSLDILANMYKPIEQDTSKTPLTKDLLSSIKEKIEIDSINILNADIKYGESNSAGSITSVGYNFHFGSFHASTHDSEIVANNLEVYPLVDDNQFFDESKFRRTRFNMILRQLKISGVDYKGFVLGKIYHARSIKINDASLAVLVDMYKPYKRDTVKFLMPNEMLATMKEIINVDSIIIIKGHLRYSEISKARSNPAFVTFDNVQLLAEGLSNNKKHGDTLVIHASANFMKAGIMKAILYVPLTSPEFCMQYSGSLGTMELNKLNSFVEIAEHKRVKSGIVHSASFDIQVKDGQAIGLVSASYGDFKLALLDSRTGSEKGIMNKFKSFLANTFKLHGTNEKDDLGVLKLGKVSYSRKRDDTFIQYAWFALRSGVANIVGF